MLQRPHPEEPTGKGLWQGLNRFQTVSKINSPQCHF